MTRPHTTHVTVDGTDLVLALAWRDKLAALVGNQRIPLAAISSVAVVPDPLRRIAGVRSPGLAIPWGTKVGVWRSDGQRTLVAVRRGQQALRVDATGQRFDTYLIGVSHANEVATMIATAGSEIDGRPDP